MNNGRGFGSKIGFLLTMAAFCIGIGNLWKFPYVVGANGGGAFLLVYLIMVAVIGIPCFIIETTIGRTAQLSPVAGIKKLEGDKTTVWSIIGWLEVIAIFCIASFSGTVIGGWSLGYVWKTATGELNNLTPEQIGGVFSDFGGSTACMIFGAIGSVLLYMCLCGGVKKGVEKVCSILMPCLFVILILLAIYANTFDGAREGLIWYLKPDFSKINLGVVGAATSQAFFSIGIGMCVAFVYGSYLKKDIALPGTLSLTAFMDAFIAFLAGLICTPALFAFNMEPTAGPSLIFVTLPQLFNAMGGIGRVFGTLFMICVFAAGFSSWLGACESLVASLTDSTKLNRKAASMIVVVVCFLVSIFTTLVFREGSFMASVKIIGMDFFSFLDFLSSGLCMPIVAVLMYVYAIWHWGFRKFQTEVNAGAENAKLKITDGLGVYFKYILPVLLIFAVYSVIKVYFG